MHWHWQRFVVNTGGVPPLSGKYCHWGGCCRRRPQTSLPFSPPSSLSRGHASSLAEPGLRLSAVSWLAGAFAPLLVARRPWPPPASSLLLPFVLGLPFSTLLSLFFPFCSLLFPFCSLFSPFSLPLCFSLLPSVPFLPFSLLSLFYPFPFCPFSSLFPFLPFSLFTSPIPLSALHSVHPTQSTPLSNSQKYSQKQHVSNQLETY